MREVVTNYPVDLMYFDGPYQGMDQRSALLPLPVLPGGVSEGAGKSIPLQNATTTLGGRF